MSILPHTVYKSVKAVSVSITVYLSRYSASSYSIRSIWFLGFAAYRLLMHVDTPVGNTLPDMAVTIGMCLAYHWLLKPRLAAAGAES